MKRIDLNQPHQHNPFSVPDGYFESLSQRVMQNIEAQQAAEQPKAETGKTMELKPQKRGKWWAWTAAVAACVAAAVLFIGVPEGNMPTPPAPQTAQAQASSSDSNNYQEEVLQYAMVDNYDIYAYLSGENN